VSGTPVIAMARGAANEIVEPGVTGWLGRDAEGIVDAYSRLGEIDLERCVKRAGERFGPTQMADGYQSVYERAIEESYYRDKDWSGPLAAGPNVTVGGMVSIRPSLSRTICQLPSCTIQ
jgi:hypothetical protein